MSRKARRALAIAGGPVVRTASDWPRWPRTDPRLHAITRDALESGRWAVSGPWTGEVSYEQRFADAFAAFNGTDFCVPTDHGSSSLVIALEALDVGAYDEVIVPALTWVATATAVVNVNAVPVFVDVDPGTFCISPRDVEAMITSETKAILAVHLHWLMADMDALLTVARRHDIPIIEDCAQAHGARWRGHSAGTLGTLGTFSMQQMKVLTAGEGGAVITRDRALHERLQELRADSRRYTSDPIEAGQLELRETNGAYGTNHCLTEVQAAILLNALRELPAENHVRQENAVRLARELSQLELFEPLTVPAAQDRVSVYEYAFRIHWDEYGVNPAEVRAALAAELGFSVYAPDIPVYRNELYNPGSKRRHHLSDEYVRTLTQKYACHNAEYGHASLALFHHSVLLADAPQIDAIVEACAKVNDALI